MPPFATIIQKATWPVSRVFFRGEPPEEPAHRMTTAAIRMRARLDLDREEMIDGDKNAQQYEPNPRNSSQLASSPPAGAARRAHSQVRREDHSYSAPPTHPAKGGFTPLKKIHEIPSPTQITKPNRLTR